MNVFWLLVIACAVILIQMFIFRAVGQKGIQYSRHLSVDRAQIDDHFEMVEDIFVRRFIPVPC